jgi:hypothetical protein
MTRSPAGTGPLEGRRQPPWQAAATAVPVTALVSLYLLATGRWGSYVGPPGVPVYIGDVGVALAVLQVSIAVVRGKTSLRHLRNSPLILLLVVTLLAYAGVRLAAGLHLSVVALRDVAPYGYAVVAVLTFLLPARAHPAFRPAIYGVLVFHLAWASGLRLLPGYPWHLPVLGTDAMIFVIRPDSRWKSWAPWQLAGLAGFAALSTVGMLAISTRAGMLAGATALAAVVLSARRTIWSRRLAPGQRTVVRAAVTIGALGLVVAAGLTPAGSRLLSGFGIGTQDGASGTVNARIDVWSRVGDYVISRPDRTAVGVGFGRDFIAESGAAAALEGIYQNVRSPHNYVVGTLARLGVAGALLTAIVILMGWWWAMSTLTRWDTDPPTVLACLVAIAIPIAGLLGVVLESPFGAIPYFWALGQLAASRPDPPAVTSSAHRDEPR